MKKRLPNDFISTIVSGPSMGSLINLMKILPELGLGNTTLAASEDACSSSSVWKLVKWFNKNFKQIGCQSSRSKRYPNLRRHS